MKIARYIDHAVLAPGMTPQQIRDAIQLGIDYEARTVCVHPRDIETAVEMCRGTQTDVSCVLDFPHGAGGLEVKRAIAAIVAPKGILEIDMVMNYGAALGGDWDTVKKEIVAVVNEAHPKGVGVKVILETSELDEETIKKACEVSVEAGADFVKTSTGFASGGATVEAAKLMLDTVAGRAKVKPSGGIRTYEDAKRYVDMGASRLGIGFKGTPKVCDGEPKE